MDGPTGVYQKLNADGTIAKAYIYLTMRRGGRLIYALDVTQPSRRGCCGRSATRRLASRNWARPGRVRALAAAAELQDNDRHHHRHAGAHAGAGVRRRLRRLAGCGAAGDRLHGARHLHRRRGKRHPGLERQHLCADGVATCKKVSGKYATPADIAFVDRDLNGFTDKMYWGDLSGPTSGARARATPAWPTGR